MSVISRQLVSLVGLALCGAFLSVSVPASAEVPEPPQMGLVSESEAVALAADSGEPVVATAETDEHTLVTADPETGLLSAELSAGVARVPDGEGGWREPSATLVPGPDGAWVAEAPATPVTVSGGGEGVFLTLGDDASALEFEWPQALPVPVVDGNLATYPEVAPGVDLVVRAAVDGAESFLVVKDAVAAQDPLVRSMPISIAGDGVVADESSTGTVVYVDEAGEEQFWVPPAYLWDSAGQPEDASLADLLEPAEGARVEEMPAEVPAGAAGRVAFDPSVSAWDVLDDPDTVFPVVMDPSGSGSRTYAVRVTQDFNKYNSDIGSEGKLGYNGWTSPYYKSRMYYQFKWHTHGNIPVAPERIISAEFEYLQVHSPQHSCTDNDYGPSVKVQFHKVIDSDTTWSNQPDVHSGIGSASDDYAVGHEDHCNKTYTQDWNVSNMVLAERYKYPDRTTVTVGIRSNDEGDKNGWREYKYSSAKLTVTYEIYPPIPTALTFAPLIPNEGNVTRETGGRLTAKPVLLTGRCPDSLETGCLKVTFAVVQVSDGVVVFTKESGPLNYAALASVDVPALTLADNTTYRVEARTTHRKTGDSGAPATLTLLTDFAPIGVPTVVWASSRGKQQLTVTAQHTEPGVSYGWALYLGDATQPTATGTWSRPAGNPDPVVEIPVGAPAGYVGYVRVKVWAIDSRGTPGPDDEIAALIREEPTDEGA